MMTDVQARRAVGDRRVRISVLAPVGQWYGVGDLRVLRVRAEGDDALALTLGYASYERGPQA
jgi:hypothetical protein